MTDKSSESSKFVWGPGEVTVGKPVPELDPALKSAFVLAAIKALDKLPVSGTTVAHPVPVGDAPVDPMEADLSDFSVARVGVRSLKALTYFVPYQDVLHAIRSETPVAKPVVVSSDGQLYVYEGLAAAVAALLRADESILARIVVL